MTDGILGKKIGMTQIFGEDGKSEAITAIEAGPCTITQVKTDEKDGYSAAQLGMSVIGPQKSSKRGRSKDKDTVKYRYLREIRVDDVKDLEPGQTIDVSLFKAGDMVNITGISKGKGFAGTVKRHHFAGGPKTHGQSDRHRAPGSIGATTTPGRVFKGMRMAGHMGNERITVRNLEIYKADSDRNLLLVKGAVPGARNGLLIIKKTGKGKK